MKRKIQIERGGRERGGKERSGRERGGKSRSAGSRIISAVLLISLVLALRPAPAHADIFDDIDDAIDDGIEWADDLYDGISQDTLGAIIEEGLSKIGMDAVYKKAQDAFKFASDAAQGKLPMVDTILDGLENKAEKVADDAVSEMSKVTEVLVELQDVANDLYKLIELAPEDFDIEFNLPMPGGGIARVHARKQDLLVDISFWLIGPTGSGMQAVFGISNASPLGGGNAAHFANESNTITVFMDITRNGRSYVHGRLPVTPGTFPYLIAQDYIEVNG